MANIYKRKSFKDIENRQPHAVSDEDRTRVNEVLSKFVELFKQRYL